MKRRKLVAANWKMCGNLNENQALLTGICENSARFECDIAIFPPFPYLSQVQAFVQKAGFSLGAQNVSEFGEGAYTGEVSAQMLKDFACQYALVGHSERRRYFHEHDAQMAQKCQITLGCGLIPVLCVGETLAERESGVANEVVIRQLAAVFDPVFNQTGRFDVVVAYEPVWAIGTGKVATPGQAQEIHAVLRAYLAGRCGDIAAQVRLLYGGSVKAGNAGALFEQPDIDGALVGGASLVAEEFLGICAAAV